ncbi:AraC family transcriptional regulator [Xanthobacter sp. V4C-4]|uniref:helix-turn-helix transcriptional regulator n=1 Tax=Xanthobacter cornucopiae TaxID=3119924 RepID=UPI00372B1961
MKREIPQHLFVGTMEGVPACACAESVYDIWPKFVVMVLLQGAQHFVIDDSAFRIDAGAGETARPLVFMLNVARFARLRFVNDSRIPLRKVMISAPHPWMEWLMRTQGPQASALRPFLAEHLASFTFAASGHVRQLAEQILSPPPSLAGELRTLHCNSRALDIMCVAGLALAEAEEERRPVLASRRQSERVRDYVVEHLDRALTIEEIARAVGASVSSVQRHFKEHFRMTVFDFIRRARLAQACEALERDGVTIAQAAYAAGYNDPSNFAVAFKKVYGVPPRCKRR